MDAFITRRGGGAIDSGALDFSYSGTYSLETDPDNENNWVIKFLSSGILVFNKTVSVDAFLVGGGGGSSSVNGTKSSASGGGGYTVTKKNIVLTRKAEYVIEIGAGGAGLANPSSGGEGGATSAFNFTANGGKGGIYAGNGGDGGTGGNPYASNDPAKTNGADGYDYQTDSTKRYGGKGQGTTTRAFGESDGQLYASGGANNSSATAGAYNTGNGGGYYGSYPHGGNSGGSGIVIIRNTRSVA